MPLTDFVMGKHHTPVSNQNSIEYLDQHHLIIAAYLIASASMSLFKRLSMASRFSARSESGRVRRGSEASRRTNGRPEIYTEFGTR